MNGWLMLICLLVSTVVVIGGLVLIFTVWALIDTELKDKERYPDPSPAKLFNHKDLVSLIPNIKRHPALYLEYGSRARKILFNSFSSGPLEVGYSSFRNNHHIYTLRGCPIEIPEYWLVCEFKRE